MAIKPILFNTEMVKAILGGRKTQTRRALRPKFRENEAGYQVISNLCTGQFIRVEYYDEYEEVTRYMTPPCSPGDILWVRETWDNVPVSPGGHFRFVGRYYYKADGDLRPDSWRGNWHPSIHMPKEAARIFLRVKDVRAERLRDIGADEVPMEGVLPLYSGPVGNRENYYKAAFAKLWNSTIKPADLDHYGWGANPWVWVIKFERCEKPEGWH